MKTTLINEYNVLASFANKMLLHESQIDSKIQNIVAEHFWNMIENEELKYLPNTYAYSEEK